MLSELTASEDGASLTLHWQDGATSVLTAAALRAAARDAVSERERLDTGGIAIAPGLTITAIDQVGAAAVNVAFSDGHDRAIYPFAYLAELCGRDGN